MTAEKTSRFRHKDGFDDNTAYIEVKPDGRSFIVHKDGTRARCDEVYPLGVCLDRVAAGLWEELTERPVIVATDRTLEAIEARAKAATPGPLRVRPNEHDDWGMVRRSDDVPIADFCPPWMTYCFSNNYGSPEWKDGPPEAAANAELFANAREDILNLVQQVRLLTQALNESQKLNEAMRKREAEHKARIAELQAELTKLQPKKTDDGTGPWVLEPIITLCGTSPLGYAIRNRQTGKIHMHYRTGPWEACYDEANKLAKHLHAADVATREREST